MPVLRKSELKGMSKENLKTKIEELNKELMKLQSQVARGTPPENPGKIRSLKRNIARILTMLNKKLEVGGES
ncbi:50S ribosomal protein L29 [Candidatus Woesearchaeota archaeon]|nr:50S ribosomal protein L29 [Candidatus Woesearchaeota archaeon]